MAIRVRKVCQTCFEAYDAYESLNQISHIPICPKCKDEKEVKERTAHMHWLDSLSLEDRVRRIEEWIYDHDHAKLPGDLIG